MNKKVKSTLAFVCLLAMIPFSGRSQLVVSNTTYTVTELVQKILLGAGVTATNISFVGDTGAIGFFNGLTSNIGLDSGVVLCSGNIVNAIGPNNAGWTGTSNSNTGDIDLDSVSTVNTYDAAILEFDFVPLGDTVKFRYVFGSEEYMEFVNAGVNDAFGFFISGPGISGPYTNNSKNIARVPGKTTPVTIDSVNLNVNGTYYFDNGDGSGTGTAPDGATVQYDGFTVPLTAIAKVQCGQTYHIKIAIADGGDYIYDSGVFLEASSFSSPPISISTSFSYGGTGDSVLYEGCGQACLVFSKNGCSTLTPDTIVLTIAGTALNGTDYTAIPDTLFFAIGQTSVTACINAISGDAVEGLETVNITARLIKPNPPPPSSATIYINDYFTFTVTVSSDTVVCKGNSVKRYVSASGGSPPYTYAWSTGALTYSVNVTPLSTTDYTITVKDNCSSPEQRSVITVSVYPVIAAVTADDASLCLGDIVTFTAQPSSGTNPYSYHWSTVSGPDVINDSTLQVVQFTPTADGVFHIAVTDYCGFTVNDDVSVMVEPDCEVKTINVFTPNGDGKNEFLEFYNLYRYPKSKVTVFNRWGNKIYDDADYKNNWTASGVPDGTYYFILDISNGKNYKGFVTILR